MSFYTSKTYSRTAISIDKAIILGIPDGLYAVCLETNKYKIISNDLPTHDIWTVVLKRANGRRKNKCNWKNGRGGCQKAAIGRSEAERRLGTEICSSLSCCLHLAAHILKRLQLQIHLLVGISFCQPSLLLQTALRQKFAGRKTLCFALPYWFENIQGRKSYSGSIIHKKHAETCQILKGEKWHIWEDSDKITQQINGPTWDGLPAQPVTLMLSPKPVAVTSSSDFRDSNTHWLLIPKVETLPPFCLKWFLPHVASRVTLTDCVRAGLRNPGRKCVRQLNPVCVSSFLPYFKSFCFLSAWVTRGTTWNNNFYGTGVDISVCQQGQWTVLEFHIKTLMISKASTLGFLVKFFTWNSVTQPTNAESVSWPKLPPAGTHSLLLI